MSFFFIKDFFGVYFGLNIKTDRLAVNFHLFLLLERSPFTLNSGILFMIPILGFRINNNFTAIFNTYLNVINI